jgi:hypothetical protein
VKRLVGAWLFLTALTAGVLGLAWLLAPGWLELELDIFILVVGGIALVDVVILLRDAYPLENVPEIAAALEHEAEPSQRPPQLERLERELTMATATAFDLHARLRPHLRELVRPDRLPPANRHAEGIPPAELRRAVEALEAL